MKYKYYKDSDEDVWRISIDRTIIQYMRLEQDISRHWVYFVWPIQHIFSDFELVELTEDELFVELL